MTVCDTVEASRRSLGSRHYEVVFYSGDELDYEQQENNYVFRTADIGQVASVLKDIPENGWALVNLSVQESALEEIYVNLMSD